MIKTMNYKKLIVSGSGEYAKKALENDTVYLVVKTSKGSWSKQVYINHHDSVQDSIELSCKAMLRTMDKWYPIP